MLNSFNQFLTLAEGEAPKNDSFFWVILPPLALIMLMYMVMDSPQRKARARREAMMKNLKKEDRVLTTGGIIGSVANISQDGKEVTLKVDDGTRIRFIRSAIVDVLSAETTTETTKA
ncbi:preprotein translocase subunit YajC [Schlesneria sp. T3-172]|uniref:preprotein translocase subunit YajC n=1 Tax=Schlesneria TaxID=656899 RepID=UPI002F1AB0BD